MRFYTAWVVEGQETKAQRGEGLSSPGHPLPSQVTSKGFCSNGRSLREQGWNTLSPNNNGDVLHTMKAGEHLPASPPLQWPALPCIQELWLQG